MVWWKISKKKTSIYRLFLFVTERIKIALYTKILNIPNILGRIKTVLDLNSYCKSFQSN